MNRAGVVVTSNHNYVNCGGCAVVQYTNPTAQNVSYALRQSCYPVQVGSCSATTKYAIYANPAPPSPPLPPPPSPPTPPPPSPLAPGVLTCGSFNISLGQKYVDCRIAIPAQTTYAVGDCGISGASCFGNTKITLLSYTGQSLTSNDDGAPAGCGQCSYFEYSNPFAYARSFVIRQQCNPLRTSTCSGVTLYEPLVKPPPPPSPDPPPPSPPPPEPSPPPPLPPPNPPTTTSSSTDTTVPPPPSPMRGRRMIEITSLPPPGMAPPSPPPLQLPPPPLQPPPAALLEIVALDSIASPPPPASTKMTGQTIALIVIICVLVVLLVCLTLYMSCGGKPRRNVVAKETSARRRVARVEDLEYPRKQQSILVEL